MYIHENITTSLPENENKKPYILAVDDDRTMLMMLEGRLQEIGYDVITAKDGKQACSIIAKEQNNLDAILLDREMPGMDGMKVIKWMKKILVW